MMRAKKERERLISQTDQEMARSWLSAGPLLRVVMECVGWETDFGVVSSLVVVELALGRPGLLLSVFRRGSAGSWVAGRSGLLMALRIRESKQ